MTYTIRDNTGNIIFSMENTTPEVSFESIDNEFDRLMSYSNKLDKSIEAFNLISNTRAMESFGYRATEGFGEKIKATGKAIWEKIKEFFRKIIKFIKDLMLKIKSLSNIKKIKFEVIEFLKSNKLNEDFNDLDFESKQTYKNIEAIYEDEELNKFVFTFEHEAKIKKEFHKKIIEFIDKIDMESKVNKYIKLINEFDINSNYISDLEIEKESSNIICKRGKELIEEYQNMKNTPTHDIDKSIKTFSKHLLNLISSNENTDSYIKGIDRELLNIKSNLTSLTESISKVTKSLSETSNNNDAYYFASDLYNCAFNQYKIISGAINNIIQDSHDLYYFTYIHQRLANI